MDIFIGDEYTHKKEITLKNKISLKSFSNNELFKSDCRDWIKQDNNQNNFAHVDIVRNDKETYECGFRAVYDIEKNTGKKAYNYSYHNGLGIIV